MRLEQASFDVILTDFHLSGGDGMEVLEWVNAHRPETAVVMVSGSSDVRLAVGAMKAGALDFLIKPFQLSQLADSLAKAVAKKVEAGQCMRQVAALEASLEQHSGELRQTLRQLQESSAGTLEALTAALDARERETKAHSKRVSDYSVHLARKLGIGEDQLETIRKGSLLHDIGKIGVPDRILLKPDRLTPEEWVEMRKHPEIGAWIVNGVESLRAASSIVIAHHERYDGAGYPTGLRGDEIPVGARIFAVADTLDAMLSDRPYRRGQPYEEVRTEIGRNCSTQFDPLIADCFMEVAQTDWEEIRLAEAPNEVARAGRS